jgi:hypothetical protein
MMMSSIGLVGDLVDAVVEVDAVVDVVVDIVVVVVVEVEVGCVRVVRSLQPLCTRMSKMLEISVKSGDVK